MPDQNRSHSKTKKPLLRAASMRTHLLITCGGEETRRQRPEHQVQWPKALEPYESAPEGSAQSVTEGPEGAGEFPRLPSIPRKPHANLPRLVPQHNLRKLISTRSLVMILPCQAPHQPPSQ